MKRRNFLSGLLAAPLAVKAQLARFFVPTRCVERCGAELRGAPITFSTARQQQVFQLLAKGKSREAFDILKAAPPTRPFTGPRCNRPLGHKGAHMLLNMNTSWVVKKEGSL